MPINVEELPLLRQSERGAFKRCNWAWYQEYVLRHRPILENKTAADFGTLIHLSLAEYYRPGGIESRGPHPAETFDRVARDKVASIRTTEYENDELVSKWENFHSLGVELMEGYIDHYGGDPHWHILDAERRFDVVVPDVRYKPLVSEKGRHGYRPIVVLVGTFDLCVRDLNDNSVKMVDHKTCTTFQTHHLTLDEQASTYIAVATNALRHQGLIGASESVNGMEYNFIKKTSLYNAPLKQHYIDALENYYVVTGVDEPAYNWRKDLKDELRQYCEDLDIVVHGEAKDETPYMRHWVPRTPKERQRQIKRISEEAQVMDMVRSGRMPLLKTPQRDCYYCKFFDLCELDESGGDTEYFIENTMKSIDPYADHRDGADNSKKVNINGGQGEGLRTV